MPSTPATSQNRDARVPFLDGLRFLAAFLVLAHHWIGQAGPAWETPTPQLFPTAHPMAAYGWLGVQLFFLISGYVICMTAWDRSLGEFFASRVARLYPAYWFGIAVSTLVFWKWPVMYKALTARETLASLTMLQDVLHVPNLEAVYWTLAVELRFYVLFALFVVWRGVTYRRVVLFCALWTAASSIDTTVGGLNYLLIGEHSMYFVAGMALYLMRRFGPSPLLWAIVGFSWLRAQWAIQWKVSDQSGWDARPLEWSTAVLILSAFFLAVIAVALRWDRWMQWRWLSALGKLTYPLYLLHSQIGATAIRTFHKDLGRWTLLAILLVAVLAVSYLVERFVERPLGRAIRRLLADGIAQAQRPLEPAPARPAPAEAKVAPLATGTDPAA